MWNNQSVLPNQLFPVKLQWVRFHFISDSSLKVDCNSSNWAFQRVLQTEQNFELKLKKNTLKYSVIHGRVACCCTSSAIVEKYTNNKPWYSNIYPKLCQLIATNQYATHMYIYSKGKWSKPVVELGVPVNCSQLTYQGSQSVDKPQKGNSSAVQVNWGEPRHCLPLQCGVQGEDRHAGKQPQCNLNCNWPCEWAQHLPPPISHSPAYSNPHAFLQ